MKRNKQRKRKVYNFLDFIKNFSIATSIFILAILFTSSLRNPQAISDSIVQNSTLITVSAATSPTIIENTVLPVIKSDVSEQAPIVLKKVEPANEVTQQVESGVEENTPPTENQSSPSGPKLSYNKYIIYDIGAVPNESQFLKDIGAYADNGTIVSNFNSIRNKTEAGAYIVTLTVTNESGTTYGSVTVNLSDENTEYFYKD